MNYDGKNFRVISTSSNSQLSDSFVFEYCQEGKVLKCDYGGNSIVAGHLLGTVEENGEIEMYYHQINKNGEISCGKCTSRPEMMENGKLRLYEKWQWLTGDMTEGESVLEEV